MKPIIIAASLLAIVLIAVQVQDPGRQKGLADIRVYLTLDGNPVDLSTVSDAGATLTPLAGGQTRTVRLVPMGTGTAEGAARIAGEIGPHGGELKDAGGYEVEFVFLLTSPAVAAARGTPEAYLQGTVVDFDLKPGDRWTADVSFTIAGDRRTVYGFQIPFAGPVDVLIADIERHLDVIGRAVDANDAGTVQDHARRLISLVETRPAEPDKPDFDRLKGEFVAACRDLKTAAATEDQQDMQTALTLCLTKFGELRRAAQVPPAPPE